MNSVTEKIMLSADKVDNFLKKYFSKKNTNNDLFEAMSYGLFSGCKKIRTYLTKCAFDIYKKSKLANVMFTYELAKRVKDKGITANCLHPGFVSTNFGKNNKKSSKTFSCFRYCDGNWRWFNSNKCDFWVSVVCCCILIVGWSSSRSLDRCGSSYCFDIWWTNDDIFCFS